MCRRVPTKLPDLLSNQSLTGLGAQNDTPKNKANTLEAVRAAASSLSIGEQDRFFPTPPRFPDRSGQMLPGSLSLRALAA